MDEILTNSAINIGILMHYNTSLDGNGTSWGHLCFLTDTFLVSLSDP